MKKRVKIKTVSVTGNSPILAPDGSLAINNGIYLTVNDGNYLIVNK